MFTVFLIALMATAMTRPVVSLVSNDEEIRNVNDNEMNDYIEVSKETMANDEKGSKIIRTPRSCLDHLKNGETGAKVFTIATPNGPQQVFCDLMSEPGSAWTLVLSHRTEYAYKNNVASFKKPLYINLPVNERTPNLNIYRMTLAQMTQHKTQSTHWRITCNGPFVDYRDYVRARFANFDPVTFMGKGVCKKVEYINVRGHVGVDLTVSFWQTHNNLHILHYDSVAGACEFGPTPDYANSEDNFGYYGHIGTKFRCTSSNSSTTNYWFGTYL